MYNFNFQAIVNYIKKHNIVSRIESQSVDEISNRGVYKIRCCLVPSKYRLEIKFVKTVNELIYSYQLFTERSIVRWDNAPHYPKIETFPHHFHNLKGKVAPSRLCGNPTEDMKLVMQSIVKQLDKI